MDDTYRKAGEPTGNLRQPARRPADHDQASEQLRQSERRYRQLFEEAQEGIAIFAPDGQFIDANPAAQKILGYQTEELQHLNLGDLFVDPAERRRGLRQLLKHGQLDNFDVRLHNKAKEEIICRVSATPGRSPDGRIERFQSFFREVTAQKQAFKLLEESEEKFRILTERSLMGIALIQEGVYTFVNPALADIFGYDPEEIVGKSPKELFHARDWPAIEERLRRRIEGSLQEAHYEARAVTRDGRERIVEVWGSRMIYRDRPAILGTVQDITKRRRLQQELLRVQDTERRRVGQELHDGVASHLTGVQLLLSSYVEDLEQGKQLDPSQLREVEAMIQEGAEQTRRLSHGLHPANIERGGLFEALEGLVERMDRTCTASCRIERDGNGDLSELTDERAAHLYRIVQEALNNAVQHAGADHISLQLSNTNDELALCVTDDGVGIPDDQSVWNGIGLRTMRDRANLLGGHLTMAAPSEAGTKILVRVPLD